MDGDGTAVYLRVVYNLIAITAVSCMCIATTHDTTNSSQKELMH